MSSYGYNPPDKLRTRVVEPDRLRSEAGRLSDRSLALYQAAHEAEVRLARFGAEPPEGSVVRFKKQYRAGGTRYGYAAIRKRGWWFITQGNRTGFSGPRPGMSWAQLVEFVGDSKLKLATGWKELGPDVSAQAQ